MEIGCTPIAIGDSPAPAAQHPVSSVVTPPVFSLYIAPSTSVKPADDECRMTLQGKAVQHGLMFDMVRFEATGFGDFKQRLFPAAFVARDREQAGQRMPRGASDVRFFGSQFQQIEQHA